MTMQEALRAAQRADAYGRPAHERNCVYRYVSQGSQELVQVTGIDRHNSRQTGFWRTMSQRDIEADWVVCDESGTEFNHGRAGRACPKLSDLLTEEAFKSRTAAGL